MATEGHATCRHVTHPFVLAADYLVRLFCGSLLFDNLLAASTEHPGESPEVVPPPHVLSHPVVCVCVSLSLSLSINDCLPGGGVFISVPRYLKAVWPGFIGDATWP